MSTKGTAGVGEALSLRTLNRTLLERQLLLERSPLDAYGAVQHLVALQAQAPDPPYLGLWTRLRTFRADDLAELVTARRVVRMALHRNTIHLVTAEDALPLRRAVQPVLDQGLKHNHGSGLRGVDLGELAARGRELVEQRPRTFAELAEVLGPEFPLGTPEDLAAAVRNLVPLVQVPPRGLWGYSGSAAHTSAEHWFRAQTQTQTQTQAHTQTQHDDASAPADDPERALEELLIRYLAAFGPASIRDAQKWCGLTRLNLAAKRLGDRLRTYRGPDGTTALYDLAEARLAEPDTPAPVRFLPEFDNILLSFADSSRIMDPAFKSRVFTVNGRIKATVLADGFVAAGWSVAGPQLVIEPYRALSRPERAAIAAEAELLQDFLAPGQETWQLVFKD